MSEEESAPRPESSPNQDRLVEKKKFFNAHLEGSKDFIFTFVLYVRIFIFFLQLFFSSWNFSTDAFKGIPLRKDEQTCIDWFIWRLFRGFHQWDAVHMIHIAEHGYVLESSLAFFPLYPLVVRYLSYLWGLPLVYFGLAHMSSVFLATAFFLNMVCFCGAARVLFEVVLCITRSYKQAVISVLLFAVNPASVFFSSAYTESLFALLTLGGIYFLVSNDGKFAYRLMLSLGCFALSYATRSNGFLNLGYVGFYCLLRAAFPYKDGKRVFVLRHGFSTTINNALIFLFQMVVALFAVASLVIIHGKYEQSNFCDKAAAASVSPPLMSLAKNEGVATVGQTDAIEWCRESPLFVPPFYATIQSKYWNVTWFGYWKLSKLPCFLMVAPALAIVAFGVLRVIQDFQRKGLSSFLSSGAALLPFALHSLFLSLGSLFLWNSEVLTRLLFSSSPFPYLLLAQWMAEETPRVRLSDLLQPSHMPFLSHFCWRGRLEMALFLYFIGFAVVGTNLHVMGLPFT